MRVNAIPYEIVNKLSLYSFWLMGWLFTLFKFDMLCALIWGVAWKALRTMQWLEWHSSTLISMLASMRCDAMQSQYSHFRLIMMQIKIRISVRFTMAIKFVLTVNMRSVTQLMSMIACCRCLSWMWQTDQNKYIKSIKWEFWNWRINFQFHARIHGLPSGKLWSDIRTESF